MRSILPATVAAVALLAVPIMPARSQVATIDAAEIAQTVNTLHQLEQEYTAVMGVLGTLERVIDPNGIAPGINGQQPLPGASQLSQIVTGTGGLGALSGLAGQFQQANTVYTPTSTGSGDFNAAYLQRVGSSLAGIQAAVQQAIGVGQTHITALAQIGSVLSQVTTIGDLTAVNGRIQDQQAQLGAQQAMATNLQTMLTAQQAQFQLQQAQRQRQSADAVMAYYGGTGAAPATPTITAATLPTFIAGN